jgi:CO/xanthine dehydrogenase Mo-binding subunit
MLASRMDSKAPRSSSSPSPAARAPTRQGPRPAPHKRAAAKNQPMAPASPRRKDGMPKVDGEALYVDDLRFPGLLHAALATSAHPHAWLDGVDASAAERAPGVVCVVTAKDIPGENQIGVSAKDQPLVAEKKVRWYGERIALIAAKTPRQAREAAALVQGSYRPLAGVFDVEEALQPGAPVLHDDHPTKNLAAKGCVYRGDVKRGMAGADVVVEATFDIGMQEHAYLETQGCVAVPEAEGGMTVYASMQCPFYVQGAVADVLGLPLSKVRVVQTVTGGAFGGKEDYPSEPAACAALLAWHTRRPVKLIYNRSEDIHWSSKREAQRIKHRLGAKNDGTLVAVEVDLYMDAGAYAGLGAVVAERGNASAVGPYRVPHVRIDTHTVYTCNAFSGAFRGFGHPQVAVATESQLDELARQLGMSPVELRRKNLLRAGDVTATGERLPAPVEGLETLEQAVALMDFDAVQARVRAHNHQGGRTRLGLGISTISYGCCLHAGGQFLEGAGSLVQVHKDGSVSVAVGNTEMGQGSETVLSQIAAEALGVRYERVRLKQVDTDLVPDSGPTVASRTTTMSGNAVLDGCRQLKAELLPVAARLLKAKPKQVVFEAGFVRAGAGKEVSFEAVVGAAFVEKRHLMKAGWYAPPRKRWDRENGQGQPYSAYAYATHVALVEVDTYTGRTRVKKVTCAHDVGRAIYPDGAAGQVEGGVVQGMGYAIMERLNQQEGRILNANFTDYIIPSALDTPEIEMVLLESRGVGPGQVAGPDGAKGVGEPSLIPICAAIGNAIANAVGERVLDMPFMPEQVLKALARAGTSADPLALLPAA